MARKGSGSDAGRGPAGRWPATPRRASARGQVGRLEHGHAVDGTRVGGAADRGAGRHHGDPEAEPGRLGDPLRQVADPAQLTGQADLAHRHDALRRGAPMVAEASATATARSLAGSVSRAPPTVEAKTSWAWSSMPQCCCRTASTIATRDAVEPGRRTPRALERRWA